MSAPVPAAVVVEEIAAAVEEEAPDARAAFDASTGTIWVAIPERLPALALGRVRERLEAIREVAVVWPVTGDLLPAGDDWLVAYPRDAVAAAAEPVLLRLVAPRKPLPPLGERFEAAASVQRARKRAAREAERRRQEAIARLSLRDRVLLYPRETLRQPEPPPPEPVKWRWAR